jgi:tRNA/rRNA methyltransferase
VSGFDPDDFSKPHAPRVVLVSPRGGANVGSVCRALKNMGGGTLYVVNGRYDRREARRMAVHAGDIFESRREVETLAEALEGAGTVVGTTARGGHYRDRAEDVRTVCADLASELDCADPTVLEPALVFGPEESGLANEHIGMCQRLVAIPTAPEYTSLNLAQAALLCLYEIHCSRRERRGRSFPGSSGVVRADAGAVEEMFTHLEAALFEIGFASDQTSPHVMQTLRGLLGRAGLDEREVRVFRGIARQIAWYARGGHEVAAAKRAQGEKIR